MYFKNSNAYKRIKTPGPANRFNSEAPFEILPWLLDHDLAIMAVPELSSDEERDGDDGDDEDEFDDDNVDGGDGGDVGVRMEMEIVQPEQGGAC